MSYSLPHQTTNLLDEQERTTDRRMNSAELQEELAKCHRDSYGWAMLCCARQPAEAENILQTAYLKILEGKAHFDGKATFKTWLFAVIRRTAVDIRRREMLRRFRLVKHREKIAHQSEPVCFDEAVFRSEIQAAFEQALTGMPKRQQEVLQLVFYHDLSLAEAATVMGVSTGAARTHYERGKKQLRQRMASRGIFDESQLGRTENQTAIS